MNSIVK